MRSCEIVGGVLMVAMMCSAVSIGQTRLQAARAVSTSDRITGSLEYDFFNRDGLASAIGQDSTMTAENSEHRSPLKAGLFSMVVPGAGQFYNQKYWESAAFLGAEVAAWIVYAIYNSKGDKQTDDFQNFADGHWSVIQYVKWIQREFPQAPTQGIYSSSYDPSHPWDYVDWSLLNACENYIAQSATSGNVTGFTHVLPRRPDQQYYELIGKYPQFLGGWDDGFNRTSADVLASNVSKNFHDYSVMRGHANDLYTIAQGAAIAILANHLFSAVEAAWTAAKVNHHLELRAHIQPRLLPNGATEFASTVNVKLEF